MASLRASKAKATNASMLPRTTHRTNARARKERRKRYARPRSFRYARARSETECYRHFLSNTILHCPLSAQTVPWNTHLAISSGDGNTNRSERPNHTNRLHTLAPTSR
ncbi:unnamed protein product, partial [Ixodes pacificus]